MWSPVATLTASLALLLAAAPTPAQAEENPAAQPPFGGERPPELVEPESRSTPPSGFAISATQAIAAADETDVVREEKGESPAAAPAAFIRGDRWQVSYLDPDGMEVAQVIVDGESGVVDEAWRDHQVETKLARGYEDAVAQKVNSPWIWISLSLLFVAPFFDPRRPLRLVHLDLLALLGLGLSLFFFNRAEITESVALTYPVLGYFLVRMLVAGFWPRERAGSLVPIAPGRWLAIGIVVLLAGRAILNIVDSQVIDIGVASVIGGDRVGDGQPLYEGGFSVGIDLKGDVYGPFNYLAYLPFELLFGWDGTWDDVPAAHAAAITFDLLCVLGLLALGRRLRTGAEGRALGLALAFAWVACPWTLYAMNANANDGLIAALGIGAMLTLASPAGRGVMVALAAAAKFGSAAVAPLFATGDGERRWRSALIFSIAFAAAAALCLIPFLPDGGLREFYDRTFGYQATRGSPFSVWGLAPSLDFAQPLVRAAAASLALSVAFWPRFKTPVQVAALAAAVTIAIQLTATHWFYFYVVWFLPFVLVACFGEWTPRSRAMSADAREEPAELR
jgi:hypothetical protein